jgi:Haloacid Dehalogenase superfamily, subfamily IB, phosphoserine phosphatase-like
MISDIPMVPIAFIDLDDTLVHKNTNTLWIEWRLKKDPRAVLELLIALNNKRYMDKGILKANQINIYYHMRTIGLNLDSYNKTIDQYFDEKGRGNIYPDSYSLIAKHKDLHIKTVLITGQEELIACRFKDHLGIDDLISNQRIIENKKLGRFKEPNCYGEGKIELANRYLSTSGYKLDQCSFYTDSISDLPLLEKVKYPVIINPDKELESIARDRNWPIYEFKLNMN